MPAALRDSLAGLDGLVVHPDLVADRGGQVAELLGAQPGRLAGGLDDRAGLAGDLLALAGLGRELLDERSPAVHAATLVFRLGRGKPTRDKGQLEDRPRWPDQRLAPRRGEWFETLGSKTMPPAPRPTPVHPGLAAILAYTAPLDYQPSNRELAKMLEAKGLKPKTASGVWELLKKHPEWTALVQGRPKGRG
jgi:hypothetical protein